MNSLLSPKEYKTSETDQSKPQRSTAQFWYNQDKDKFYVIDWKGKVQMCDSGGKEPAKYNPMLTGFATFNQRREQFQTLQSVPSNDGEIIITPTKSLNFLKEAPKNTYLPQLNKFEGYVQFRCPLKKSGLAEILTQNQQKKGKSRDRKSLSKEQFTQQLPQIKEQMDENKKDNQYRNSSIIDKKNLSALYKSYKNPTTRSTEYFQQQRKSQYSIKNQSKVLDEYAKYLSSSIKKPKQSRSVVRIENENNQDFIKATALSISQDKTIGMESQKKILEYSMKILSQQMKDNELREPPPQPQPRFVNHQRSQVRLLKSQEDYNDSIQRDDSQDFNRRSYTGLDTINQSTIRQATKLYTQSTMQSINLQSEGFGTSPQSNKASHRYKSYTDLKSQQQVSQTISSYTQLRHKDQELISGFLSVSPRQEFEKELQMNKNMLLEDNGDQDQTLPFVKETQDNQKSMDRSYGRSLSPRVKNIIDFQNPFTLSQVKLKTKEDEKLEKLKELKQRTSGRFIDDLNVVLHAGQFWKKDKQLLMKSNPHARMILKKNEDFEMKRLKNKKQQKRLQAIALEQEMKIEDKKIYKKFVKLI